MTDLTESCLTDVRQQNKEVSLKDLRMAWCSRCQNPTCEVSKDLFSSRVNNQLSRFFEVEQVKQSDSEKWSRFPDFKVMVDNPNWNPEGFSHTPKIVATPAEIGGSTPRRNTAIPKGGLYVGGKTMEALPKPETAPDPWAHPTIKVVKPGAKIQLGD
jgi:hypothetical protein